MGTAKQKRMQDLPACYLTRLLLRELTNFISIRKIRCDESLPVCNRCVAARRICPGYFLAPSSAVVMITRPLPTPNPEGGAATATELMLSSYLHTDMESDEFNDKFWRMLLPQAAHHITAVRHARNAVAASRWSERECADPARRDMAARCHAISLQQHSLSVRQILGMTQQAYLSVLDKAGILLANFLFGLCSAAQSHRADFLALVARNIQLIRVWKMWRHIGADRGRVSPATPRAW